MTSGSVAGGGPVTLTRRPSPLQMLWITAALGACFLGIRWGLRDAPVLWFAALRALIGGTALGRILGTVPTPARGEPVEDRRVGLTYRRANHANIHVRGYEEEGTTTPSTSS